MALERDLKDYLFENPEVLFPDQVIASKRKEVYIEGRFIDLLFEVDGVQYIVEGANKALQCGVQKAQAIYRVLPIAEGTTVVTGLGFFEILRLRLSQSTATNFAQGDSLIAVSIA